IFASSPLSLHDALPIWKLFRATLVLACAFGTVSLAAAQVTPPVTPSTIAVPAGNSAYLVGHAFGSQGYTCLPTSTGGTAWNPSRSEEHTSELQSPCNLV